jgi:hypothetical protein
MPVVLGSWKEIANYLGKGVRTVQRWERHSGLPVHRPSDSKKGVVLAFPKELDRWARGIANNGTVGRRVSLARNAALSAELIKQAKLLRESTLLLMERCSYFLRASQQRSAASAKDGSMAQAERRQARAS